MKLAWHDETLHVFMLMRIIIGMAGRSALWCGMLEKEGKTGKWKLGKVSSTGKGIFL